MDNPPDIVNIENAAIYGLIICCLLASAYFSRIETALIASHRANLEKLAGEDGVYVTEAIELLENPTTAITMAQAGITLASILTGVGIGGFIAPTVAAFLDFLPPTEANILSIILSIALVSAITLLLSDVLPKQLVLQNPEKVLLRSAGSILFLTRLTIIPITALITVARSLLSIFGITPRTSVAFTEGAIKDLIEQATEDGTFEKTEMELVDRVFHMSDQTVNSIMTSRTQMKWLDLAESPAHNWRLIRDTPQEVFLVGRENLDDYCGIIYTKDLLNAALAQNEEVFAEATKTPVNQTDLDQFVQKPMFVPRTMEALRVLEKFRDSGIHEAVVLDEYGGVVGFITMDNIVSELIGDSVEETASSPIKITALNSSSWEIDGLLPIDDFKEEFNIDTLPDEDHDHFQTMGGFLTACFGYIPKKGESCQWENYSFEVLQMDRSRIAKILMKKI